MTIHIGDRPEKLTDEVIAKILYFAEADLLLNNAARCARVHEDTLKRWMELGRQDIKDDRETFLASFYLQVREKQALKISKLLDMIETGAKNWQALAWKLEKCFREDFGLDAPEYKELLDRYLELSNDLKRLRNDRATPQGGLNNGREMDCRSNQAQGGTQKGIGCQEGQEDSGQET
jgi:hypothetical protein